MITPVKSAQVTGRKLNFAWACEYAGSDRVMRLNSGEADWLAVGKVLVYIINLSIWVTLPHTESWPQVSMLILCFGPSYLDTRPKGSCFEEYYVREINDTSAERKPRKREILELPGDGKSLLVKVGKGQKY